MPAHIRRRSEPAKITNVKSVDKISPDVDILLPAKYFDTVYQGPLSFLAK